MPQLLYEFVALLTKQPTEAQINKCILSLRYHHRNELPNFINFSVLLLSCRNLISQREVFYSTIEEVLKRLLLEADFFFILVTYSKLLPLLVWAQNRPSRQVDECLGPAFRELTKAVSAGKSKVGKAAQGSKYHSQYLQLLRLLESKNFFLFYFQLINGPQDQQHNIDFYFLQLQTDNLQQTLLSSSQIAVIQRNFYLEYAKLRKRKYKEELIRAVYRWLELEVLLFRDEPDTPANRILIDTLSQVIRSQSNICGATLLQVLDTSLEGVHKAKMHYFLELMDICILEGTYKIATQTILFLLCTLFLKIQTKKTKVSCAEVLEHLQLWKQVAIKRTLPTQLMNCLTDWLPFLYGPSRITLKGEPQILQLYRKELIRLENESNLSEISGLKLVIEQLQYRKIEALYAQLQEFHDEIAHPQIPIPTRSSNNKKLNFSYKISGLSRSNSEINSLLNSLESKPSHRPDKSRNLQLQLLSKPHSLSGNGSFESERSFGECVEIILSLIDLFDYHVKEASLANSEMNAFSQAEEYVIGTEAVSLQSNILPIISTMERFPSHLTAKNIPNSHSAMQRREVSFNCPSQSEESKKRMAKHRGLITKSKWLEIGYLFETAQDKLSLFVTVLRPTAKVSLRLRGKSFKFRNSRAEIAQPRVNKQYKLSFEVESVKLYSLQGVDNSQRLVRSKLEVRVDDIEEIYDVPISVFNLIEWIEPLPSQQELYQGPPILQTKWLPACPQLAKHGEGYFKRFFAYRPDSQGGFKLKAKFLGRVTMGRVLQVLGEVKVVLLGDCEWVVVGVLQVLL